MKRITLLLLIILTSAFLLASDDTATGKQMSGYVCNSKCVVQQSADKATCDQGCTETGGTAVFVDDQGTVYKISERSQPMAKPHMGKHMRMMATMDEQQKELDRIHFLNLQAP
jgi:hypothetical protein